MEKDCLGVGLIGAGRIGRLHAQNLAHRIPQASLRALSDVNRKALESCAAELAVPLVTDDYRAVLDAPDVRAVAICSSTDTHSQIIEEAAAAGKHIFCEKPIAVTVSQADVMVDAVNSSGVVFGVDYQMRASEPVQNLRSLILSGSMGKLHRVDMRYTSLRPEHYYRMGDWRGTWAGEGGGVTLNQGTHPIDVFQWIFGQPIELQAFAQTCMHDIGVEDSASAMLRFQSGAGGYIHVSTCEYPDSFRFDIYCDKGRVVLEDTKLRIGRFDIAITEKLNDKDNWRPSSLEWEETETARIGWGNHDGMLDDFIQALIQNRPPLSTAEDARRSLEITNAIILSSNKRKPVTFPIDRDEYDRLLADLVRQEREEKKD